MAEGEIVLYDVLSISTDIPVDETTEPVAHKAF